MCTQTESIICYFLDAEFRDVATVCYQSIDVCFNGLVTSQWWRYSENNNSMIFNPWCICASVTVVVLCVSVTTLAATCILPRLYVETKVPLGGVFNICGFRWKRFVQKFWQHLLTTSALLASWQALNRQKRQRSLHFKKTSVYIGISIVLITRLTHHWSQWTMI